MTEQRLTVLIVDDRPEDQETVRRYLRRDPGWNYSFLEAEMGGDGLKLYFDHQPDCVLLEYQLPDMTGLEFLERLARETDRPFPPAVMLTGTGDEAIAVQAMKSGAQDYLIKGRTTPEALRRALHNAVEKARMLHLLEDQRRELEQKNRELEAADHRKNEFLAVLAHELRNPLAAIRNAVELLKLAGADERRFRQAVDVLQRQVHQQSHLLDDLLDISRITRGKVLLRPQRVDLARLIRDTVQDHRPELEQEGIAVSVDVPAEPVWVTGDPVRLAQVLGNLLNNAAKFTDRGGQVEVCLTPEWETGRAVLKVMDTGIGVSAEALPHVFEPFRQGEGGIDRSSSGLGLGLALVKGLVELHGGEVRLSSGGLGHGAEFRITLPLETPSARLQFPEGTAAVAGTEPGRKRCRILIIEDNPDAAHTSRDLLELFGHEVEIAYTGRAGVEAARRILPDVILCDLGLPQMDGFEVAAALRCDPTTAATLLIAISG